MPCEAETARARHAQLVERHSGARLRRSNPRPTALKIERSIALLYFSFTTLTTVGFGDIMPVSGFARMFSVTEAIAGQVILVVLFSRLVGMHVAQSTGGRPAESRSSELE